MRKTLAIILLIAVFTSGTRGQSMKRRLDSVMNYYAQTFDYNGVALISCKGETLLKRGYGYQDRYKNIPNEAGNMFLIGSITKQFTAELILMLAKEGRLSLEDKLSRYYPDYPSGSKITIEQLLTHTSGIYNYTEDTVWNKYPARSLSHEQMLTIFRDKPLEFEPGSKFEYCNSGYILLSYIIENITGKPYTVVARERILTPLGMKHSGFDFTHLADKRKAVGYNCVLIDSFYTDKIEDSTQSLGAGAMYSTVDDLYKWHRALQAYQLLDKAWQQKAYIAHKGNYGYGWFIADSLAGRKVLAHSGAIKGFRSYFLRIEQEDLCVVLLSNVLSGGTSLNDLAKNIVKCMYDSGFRIPAARKEITLPDAVLKSYEGQYVLAADTSVSFAIDQRGKYLHMTMTGQPEDRIYAQSDHLFFAKSADAQFEFVADAKRGYKLVLHQHGQLFEAIRR